MQNHHSRRNHAGDWNANGDVIGNVHSALRLSIGCRKHRHGDQDIRGDARDMEILIWSQCEFVEAQRHTNRPSLRIT